MYLDKQSQSQDISSLIERNGVHATPELKVLVGGLVNEMRDTPDWSVNELRSFLKRAKDVLGDNNSQFQDLRQLTQDIISASEINPERKAALLHELATLRERIATGSAPSPTLEKIISSRLR